MTRDEFLDRYQGLSNYILKSSPIPVTCHAIVAIGENGEDFWGANWGDQKPEQIKQMLRHLQYLINSGKERLKKAEARLA